MHSFVPFISVIFLLLGVYVGLRTGLNMLTMKKYPTVGVMSGLNPFFPPYAQRDEDCYFPTPYFSPDGQSRQPSQEEKKMEQDQKKRCLDGVQAARDLAKTNDINTAILFLFLGAGLLVSKKFILK